MDYEDKELGSIARDPLGKKTGNFKRCVCCTKVFIAKQSGNVTCSKVCSSQNRSKSMSKTMSGRTSWNSGKTGVYSEETKKSMGAKNIGKAPSVESQIKRSESLKEYYQQNDHHMKGGNLTKEHRGKIKATSNEIKELKTRFSFGDITTFCTENSLDLITKLPITEYLSQHNYVQIKCRCSSIYDAKVQNLMILGGYRKCKICSSITSEGEEQLRKFLSDEVCLYNRRPVFMKGFELDIFIPDKKLAVEYHGLAHHSMRPMYGDKDPNKYKSLHLDKYFNCKAANIRLIQVFGDEWQQKPEIIKSIILSKLKRSSTKISGRNCEIKEVSKSDAEIFQNQTHITGFTNAIKFFGLYYENELVSCISFRTTWNKKYGQNVIEIARFSSKLNTQIHGGFQKLLEYSKPILKSENFNKILTYADCRFGSGDVYAIAGFTHLGHTGAGYFYEKAGVREGRFRHRKDNSIPGTEISQNEERGWYRIYDAGSEIYTLDI